MTTYKQINIWPDIIKIKFCFISSSGGDESSPGFAIYRHGANLGAIVSTGNLTWSVEVTGVVPDKYKWTNLAVRWTKPVFKDQDEFDQLLASGMLHFALQYFDLDSLESRYESRSQWDRKNKTLILSINLIIGATAADMGGIQLFVNLDPVGQAIQADIQGCHFDTVTGDFVCDQSQQSSDFAYFDPPEIMVGCQRTMANSEKRSFASGGIDELAIWDHRLNDTELPYFLGGHSEFY